MPPIDHPHEFTEVGTSGERSAYVAPALSPSPITSVEVVKPNIADQEQLGFTVVRRVGAQALLTNIDSYRQAEPTQAQPPSESTVKTEQQFTKTDSTCNDTPPPPDCHDDTLSSIPPTLIHNPHEPEEPLELPLTLRAPTRLKDTYAEESARSRISIVERIAAERRATAHNKQASGVVDSQLQPSEQELIEMQTHHKTDDSFHSWFKETLPPGETLKHYTEETLADVTPRLGLEQGGTGSALFGGFSPGFFDSTRSVNLTDPRPVLAKQFQSDTLAKDEARNHSIIEGGVLDPETLAKVDEWRDGRQLSFVIERMFAGLITLPDNPFLLASNANEWYKRLAVGGLMFFEVPLELMPLIKPWEKLVRTEAPALDVQSAPHYVHTLLRIHKRPGSPETLPLISARKLIIARAHYLRD